jgi:hypothetical protein
MNANSVRSEGALFELISRGNKDVYFFADTKTTIYPYDNRYEPTPPYIQELRRIQPLQATEFGRPLEFEFEIAGDIVIDPTLVIDLPTWLPVTQAKTNGYSVITDTNGMSYGYVNGIAYFLFEKIQFYQDRILLQEWSGDGLFVTSRSRGTLSSAFLDNATTGIHSGTALEIARNATPGQLRLRLPLAGCQGAAATGFPRICANQQVYRIRCVIRKLEDLIENSAGTQGSMPWDRTDFIQRLSATAEPVAFSTIARTDIASLSIVLETAHLYTDRDTQEGLRAAPFLVPFERVYENNFTQGSADYAIITRGGVPLVKRLIDGEHPVGRIVMGFRSAQSLRANQRWNYTAPTTTGDFYTAMSLLIAGRDREANYDKGVWNQIVQHAKEERHSGYNFVFLNWTLGDLIGPRPLQQKQLDGSINFTTADKPTLLITLAAIPNDPIMGSPNSSLDVYVEGWAALEFEKGRASLLFGN